MSQNSGHPPQIEDLHNLLYIQVLTLAVYEFWGVEKHNSKRDKACMLFTKRNLSKNVILRVNFRKNQNLSKGSFSRGPSIWLIFIYIVQFFTLILVVLYVFHKNVFMQDYGSFKFWQTRSRKNSTFLFLSQIEWGFQYWIAREKLRIM